MVSGYTSFVGIVGHSHLTLKQNVLYKIYAIFYLSLCHCPSSQISQDYTSSYQ